MENNIKITEKTRPDKVVIPEKANRQVTKRFTMWDIESWLCTSLFCLAMIIIGVFL